MKNQAEMNKIFQQCIEDMRKPIVELSKKYPTHLINGAMIELGLRMMLMDSGTLNTLHMFSSTVASILEKGPLVDALADEQEIDEYDSQATEDKGQTQFSEKENHQRVAFPIAGAAEQDGNLFCFVGPQQVKFLHEVAHKTHALFASSPGLRCHHIAFQRMPARIERLDTLGDRVPIKQGTIDHKHAHNRAGDGGKKDDAVICGKGSNDLFGAHISNLTIFAMTNDPTAIHANPKPTITKPRGSWKSVPTYFELSSIMMPNIRKGRDPNIIALAFASDDIALIFCFIRRR